MFFLNFILFLLILAIVWYIMYTMQSGRWLFCNFSERIADLVYAGQNKVGQA